jgi:hypothetical protein
VSHWCALRPRGARRRRTGRESSWAGLARAGAGLSGGRVAPDPTERAHEAPTCGRVALAALGVALCCRRSQSGLTMPNRFTSAAQRAGWEAGIARANQRAADLASVIADLRAAGITSKKGIAKALNKRAVRTPRGVGEWRAIQVARVLARLPA